ncbi:MAG: O-antigen ligase family protein [Moraxellaceae bacterium]|nr:O-antigen ligase family protein [Pseudobdellovibrionaceae bacterium]
MVQVLFGLFGLSFLISKSAFTLLYTVVVLFGLFKFKWSIVPRLPVLEKALLVLFPVAIALNFFSVGGSGAALEVLTRWTWPLIYFPFVYLHENKNERILFFKGLGLSLLIACLYSFFRFSGEFDFDSSARVSSFWDILRWAYFLAVAITILFSILIKTDFIDAKTWKFVCLLLVMAVASLVLTSSRGAWMGALAGTFCVLISQRKSLKYYIGYGVLVFLILFSNTGIRHRILSSFDIKREEGKITSEDGSNAGRLHMWKVATDLYQEVPFFGVGFNNSKYTLKDFIEKQGPEYAQRYTKIEYSYNDQHSSYMTLLLQFGGIYFIFLYGFFLVATYKARRDEIYIPAMMCTYVVYFFYSAIVSFEAVVIFGLISLMILKLRKIPIK